MKKVSVFIAFVFFMTTFVSQAQEDTGTPFLDLNKPERLEWFKELGFGLFIHFSFDSQLGIVISHSMAGASEDYLDRFVNDLPETFNPSQFDAYEIATLAKLAGMKYIVFTTKHHSGFCMWDTKTTDFNIMNTPYGRDLIAEYVEAVRKAGLAVGFYYSPEDFNFLYKNGLQVRRRFPEPIAPAVMGDYLELVELQCMELMAQYGDIDIIFFDGGEGPLQEKCKEVVWNLQPDIIVTRGAIKTPEQTVLGVTSEDPWESCITMGTQWAYKPTNENYKSGKRLIEILIETRAKGGNLLLNVGPEPGGQLPKEQEQRLREIAAWNFINMEAIEDVEPWIFPNEENIWFTWKPEEKTLYAFLTNISDWPRGSRKNFTIKSVAVSQNSTAGVLGQSGELVEYQPGVDASTYLEQKDDGVHISCVRAQRIYNNHQWHNPVVLKITNAIPSLEPPVVITHTPEIISTPATRIMFKGEVTDTGNAEELKVGFQYRRYAGFVEELESNEWQETDTKELTGPGNFSLRPSLEKEGLEWQVRAFAEHPKMKVYGDIIRIRY
jgi:alpha-L-fucosidase